MRYSSGRLGLAVVGLAFGLVLGACGDDGVNVSGDWSGAALGRTMGMALTQSGDQVTGTFRVTAEGEMSLSGTVDNALRTFAWEAFGGCDAWSGLLTISDDAQSMSGQLLLDRTGCQPPQSNATDTLTMTLSE